MNKTKTMQKDVQITGGVKDLCPNEAALEFLGVNSVTLWRIRKARQIPFYKIGGRIYFKRSDLEQFLESHKVDSAATV